MDSETPHTAARQWLRLAAAGTCVRGDRLVGDPILGALVVEDLCWEIARMDWITREPSHWRRGRLARWRAEGTALRVERHRIRALERAWGLPTI